MEPGNVSTGPVEVFRNLLAFAQTTRMHLFDVRKSEGVMEVTEPLPKHGNGLGPDRSKKGFTDATLRKIDVAHRHRG